METSLAFQILVIALFSGSMACWLLKIEDSLPLILSAGIAGVYFEPWISVGVGPHMYDHSLFACIIGSLAAAFVVGLLQSCAQVLAFR